MPESGAPTRRAFCALLPAAAGVVSLSGCNGPAPASTGWRAEIPVGRIPPGGRRSVVHVEGQVIELTRNGHEVRARSMKCTHLGCEVRWLEAEKLYRCPCHEGRFDADGQPVAGPPSLPLKTFGAVLHGAKVVLTA